MKNFNLKLIYVFIILIFVIFSSCKLEYVYYEYETYIEIKYQDNTIDTIKDVRTLYYSNHLRYELETSVSGLINIEKLTPCLTVNRPYRHTNIACYVKSFKIIEQNKNGIRRK